MTGVYHIPKFFDVILPGSKNSKLVSNAVQFLNLLPNEIVIMSKTAKELLIGCFETISSSTGKNFNKCDSRAQIANRLFLNRRNSLHLTVLLHDITDTVYHVCMIVLNVCQDT